MRLKDFTAFPVVYTLASAATLTPAFAASLMPVSDTPSTAPFGPGTSATVHWNAVVAGGAKRGAAATLALSGTIEEGWHVYALTQPPGGPTALRITLDNNDIAELAGTPSGTVPQKRRDPSFGLETRFYTHAFTVQLPVQLKQQPPPGRQVIPVSVRFQTCSDRECQPPTTIHLSASIDVLPDE